MPDEKKEFYEVYLKCTNCGQTRVDEKRFAIPYKIPMRKRVSSFVIDKDCPICGCVGTLLRQP